MQKLDQFKAVEHGLAGIDAFKSEGGRFDGGRNAQGQTVAMLVGDLPKLRAVVDGGYRLDPSARDHNNLCESDYMIGTGLSDYYYRMYDQQQGPSWLGQKLGKLHGAVQGVIAHMMPASETGGFRSAWDANKRPLVSNAQTPQPSPQAAVPRRHMGVER